MALCALLLYVSDWKIEDALDKLIEITRETTIQNIDDGNFMGLNPFHDFSAWEIVRRVQEMVVPLKLDSYDAKHQYQEAQAQLRVEYVAWRQSHSN